MYTNFEEERGHVTNAKETNSCSKATLVCHVSSIYVFSSGGVRDWN